MANSFGDLDKKDAGKRPAPTIEGTATEIAVEPPRSRRGRDGQRLGPSPRSRPRPRRPLRRATRRAQAGRIWPAAAERAPRLKRFASYLGAGLLGGAVGAAGAGLAWNGLQPGGPGGAPDLATLEQRLAKLEAAPPPAASPDDAEVLRRSRDASRRWKAARPNLRRNFRALRSA